MAHAIEGIPPEPGRETAALEQNLRDHGLTPTPARLAIAGLLLPGARHVNVGTVESELQRAGHRISARLVRRTLDEFVDWDLLRTIDVGGGVVFYDTVTAPHAHVYDVDTGELRDLRPEQAWVTGLPELPAGVRLEDVQLLFRVSSNHDDPQSDSCAGSAR